MRKLTCFFGRLIFSFIPKNKIDLKKKDADAAIKRILIFKLGALGDVLMMTPFLRQVRKRFPNAKITYLVGAFCKDVLENNPNIDCLETFDHNILYKKNIPGILGLIKRVRKEHYDLCFICDMHYFINLLVYFFRIPIRIGFDRYGEGFPNTHNVPYYKVKHAIDYYLELAYLTGAQKLTSNSEKGIDIFLSKKDITSAKTFFKQHSLNSRACQSNKEYRAKHKNSKAAGLPLKPVICLAPGGAKNPGQDMATRRWPIGKFKELADKLISNGYNVVLVGSKDDELLIKKQGFNKKAINAAGRTTIKQCCCLIKLCDAAVVNDAGAMHFASAVGTPTVSLFGVTDPRRKAPLATKEVPHIYLWKKPSLKGWNDDGVFQDFGKANDIEKISVSAVFEKVLESLKITRSLIKKQ